MHLNTMNIHGHKGFSYEPLVTRMRMIGLDKYHAREIAVLIKRWLVNEGPEHTVSRLKDVKQCIMDFHAGVRTSVTWLSLSSRRYPKGAYSILQKYPLQIQMKIINLHKLFKLNSPSRKQIEKFTDALESVPQTSESAKDMVIQGLDFPVKTEFSYEPCDSIFQETLSKEVSGKKTMAVFGALDSSKLYASDALRSTLRLFEVPYLKPYLSPLMKDLIYPLTVPASQPGYARYGFMGIRPTAGIINCSQEEGCKLRFFANPDQTYQAALRPLEKVLRSACRYLVRDYSFTPFEADEFIQSRLASGQKLYCYDLSNATDRFPLSLQIEVLQRMRDEQGRPLNPVQLSLFKFVSEMPWTIGKRLREWMAIALDVPTQSIPETLKWKTGQPLGLRGSFHLFSLTHNLLIRGIEKEIYGKVRNEYCVLGDDVVIADEAVALRYANIMQELNVPISVGKGVISSRIAEFTSRVYTRKQTIIASKHKRLTRNNLFELSKLYTGKYMAQCLRKLLPLELHFMLDLPRLMGGLRTTASTKDWERLWDESVPARALVQHLFDLNRNRKYLPKDQFSSAVQAVLGSLGHSLSSIDASWRDRHEQWKDRLPLHWSNQDLQGDPARAFESAAVLDEAWSRVVHVPVELRNAQLFVILNEMVDYGRIQVRKSKYDLEQILGHTEEQGHYECFLCTYDLDEISSERAHLVHAYQQLWETKVEVAEEAIQVLKAMNWSALKATDETVVEYLTKAVNKVVLESNTMESRIQLTYLRIFHPELYREALISHAEKTIVRYHP